MNTEVRQQEKLDLAKERDFRREELPEKYMAKMLYRWDNRKFEKEYLRKLEKLTKIEVSFFRGDTLKGDNARVEDSVKIGIISHIKLHKSHIT